MKHAIIAVRDEAARTYGVMHTVQTTAVGIRQFTNEVNRADHNNPIYTNPEHFNLYLLGWFDDQTGDIVPEDAEGTTYDELPHLLIRAINAKKEI